MKIATILGTRPEIIRLSRIIPILDELCNHILIHTGQNYTRNLNEIFMEELKVRSPNYILESRSDTLMGQVSKILFECEKILKKEKPNRILILGDTNSALSAFVSKRMGIPVFHMEAGNRCFDDRVPEEVNRRVIDHCSDILMPYTERSRNNLIKEGIPENRIYVTGNPIFEVLEYYDEKINSSTILRELAITNNKYFIVTLHRAENVDIKERLTLLIEGLHKLHKNYKIPVICSVHPRTKSKLEQFSKNLNKEGVIPIEPLGLFDFVHLEKNALAVLTDSGTVQEECSIFKVPNVTLRDVTERPETIEVGSNIIAGCQPNSILRAIKTVLYQKPHWEPPTEYMVKNVSTTVSKIVLGYREGISWI